MTSYIESGFKSLLEEKKAETALLEARLDNAYRREQALLQHLQRNGIDLPKGYIPFGNIQNLPRDY